MNKERQGGGLERGKAIEIDPGAVWSIGGFEVYTAGEMSEGFQLVGRTDDDRVVTFTFMPGEAKALGGLISEHADNIKRGMDMYGDATSVPVHIRTPGAGPEMIPTNRNVHGRPGTPES